MDPITGLPMAFGKLSKTAPDASTAAANGSGERGGPGGGRGSRGVVGGGKRSRGRGGGRGGGGAGVSDGRPDVETMALNGGVKRPHPSSAIQPSLPPIPHSYHPSTSYGYPTSSRSNPNGMELGVGGGGYPGNGGASGVYPHTAAPGRGDSRAARGGRGGIMDGGSRGRGGGGGGRGGGHAPPERGFYKPSFAEDPWKDLLGKREKSANGVVIEAIGGVDSRGAVGG